MLYVLNPITGTTRHGIERQSSDFPTGLFTVCYAVYYVLDRTNLFQTPFMIAFGHTPDFVKRYVGCADGSGGTSHNFMVSNDGGDTYATNLDKPSAGRWYRHALVRQDLGGGSFQYRFYYDLPDTSKFVDRANTNTGAWDASTYAVIGAVPYTDFEGIYGRMANFKVFDVELTPAQLVKETSGPYLYTPSLSSNLWAHLPLISDGNDISGNARHFALVSGATSADVFWDGKVQTFDTVPVDYSRHPVAAIRGHYARSI